MTINKFQGKTKEEAIQKAKDEFGENAVILNVKEVKPKGMFKTFKIRFLQARMPRNFTLTVQQQF